MNGYAKLSSTILNSSIWSQPDNVRIVWITMLAMADATGFVESSFSGLAHQARKTLAETQEALAVLSAPDPDSKNPDNEGRRITKVEGGWLILNYALYRAQRDVSDDPQTAATRARVERYRERKRLEREALQGVTRRYKALQGVTSPLLPAYAYASASVTPGGMGGASGEARRSKRKEDGEPTDTDLDAWERALKVAFPNHPAVMSPEVMDNICDLIERGVTLDVFKRVCDWRGRTKSAYAHNSPMTLTMPKNFSVAFGQMEKEQNETKSDNNNRNDRNAGTLNANVDYSKAGIHVRGHVAP